MNGKPNNTFRAAATIIFMNAQHQLNRKKNRIARLTNKCKNALLDKPKSDRLAALTEELRKSTVQPFYAK
jgi:hypothetical protein